MTSTDQRDLKMARPLPLQEPHAPARVVIASLLVPLVAPRTSALGRERLRGKIARNLELGWRVFFTKSLRFARSTLASRYLLRDVNHLGVGVRVEGFAPMIDNPGGTIVIGDDVVFSAPTTPAHFAMYPKAFLSIGDESFINDGVWFGCTERITIGKRALLGPGVRIFDNNYHDTYDRRRVPPARPVTLGDDVWVASDATLLPGVTIGRGAVVAAGSLVREDVAPFSIVGGNPARQVDTIDPAAFDLLRRASRSDAPDA